VDGDCVDRCTLDQETCLKCDGAGNCIDDPSKCTGECETCSGGTCIDDDSKCTGECATCSDGNCEVCNGDPDKVCCDDGSCVEPCQEVGNETLCSSEKSVNCPGCVGLGGDCSDYMAEFYSNKTIYNCGGGCPGDCDDELFDPPCYEEHFCKDYIHYTFAECKSWSETGPVPLDCYEQLVTPWSCTRCQQGAYYRTLYVLSRRCK